MLKQCNNNANLVIKKGIKGKAKVYAAIVYLSLL